MVLCKEHVEDKPNQAWTNWTTITTIHVTAMQFGKEKKLVPYLLQQSTDSAINLGKGGTSDSGTT